MYIVLASSRIYSARKQAITRDDVYHRGSAVVSPWWTGELDCRGLRKILLGGDRAGEKKKTRLYCMLIQMIIHKI